MRVSSTAATEEIRDPVRGISETILNAAKKEHSNLLARKTTHKWTRPHSSAMQPKSLGCESSLDA